MRPTPYVASLRVYEPMDAFESAEQLRWQAIPITASTGYDEQVRALRRLISGQPPALTSDGAHILEVQGKRYASPWSTAARCWAALSTFKESMPINVVSFFVPANVEESILVNSESVEDKVPHIITETWIIPPRWFSLFDPTERVRGHNDDGPFTVLRTSITNAKKRCMFTHQSVVETFGTGPIEQEIADLLEWLTMFHTESLVELDYGGLAGYLEQSLKEDGFEGLEADTSVEDIQLSLNGLSTGDGAKAGVGYERLISRWRKVAALEQAT
ncbi:MAG: hypothetical protein WDN07_00575 [Actinomycetota bacterium]